MLHISKGTSKDGIEFRMPTAKFEGRGGPSLVLIAGLLDGCDDGMVKRFIPSIE